MKTLVTVLKTHLSFKINLHWEMVKSQKKEPGQREAECHGLCLDTRGSLTFPLKLIITLSLQHKTFE